MRAASYTVAAAPGDAAPSECVVYFFGAGQGGSIEANFERWKSQFTTAGKPGGRHRLQTNGSRRRDDDD
jgi:hypothetical protein